MKNLNLLALILFILSSCSTSSLHRKIASGERQMTLDPVREVNGVHSGSQAEEVVRLQNAKVVMADYELIRKDFPHVAHMAEHEIDEWLLNQTAYVSRAQANQTATNTQIQITDGTRQAHRPPSYNRALLFEMENPGNPGEKIGLMDAKGVGSLRPAQRDHGNGVATLGETIREFIWEKLVREVFHDANIENKTVGSYAVIDGGFDVLHTDGSTSPAGIYLRQGHKRINYDSGWLGSTDRMNLQNILHKYGIDPNNNIQGTTTGDVFDFGHFIVRDDSPGIDQSKAIPFDVWGYDKNIPNQPGDRWFYSKKDNGWNYSHEVAEAFRDGRADRHATWMHIQNMMNPVREKLRTGSRSDNGCISAANSLLAQ